MFCFRQPHHLKELYARGPTALTKPELTRNADWLMGCGTFNDRGGPQWKRKRALIEPALDLTASAALCDTLAGSVTQMLQRWCGFNGAFAVLKEVRRWVVDATFRTCFSTELGCGLDAVPHHTEVTEKMFPTQLPWILPLPSNVAFARARKALRGLMLQILTGRRAPGGGRQDVVSHLLECQERESAHRHHAKPRPRG